MRDLDVSMDPLDARRCALRGEGASVMFLAVDGALAGLPRGCRSGQSIDAGGAVPCCVAAGFRIIMATGDARRDCPSHCARNRHHEVHGEMRPG